ncbi:MAG TPA: PPC domain-containing protein, partial [Kofleriaceae bacterium]|nr:PPC domain-containing protein [Kofleriaceae bacterium]
GTPQTGSASGSVARGAWVRYQPLSVLAGSNLTVTLSGSGDPDLYIRFGSQPSTTTYSCASESPTATERCSITVPAGQSQAYIGVYGYSQASFSLNASWVAP